MTWKKYLLFIATGTILVLFALGMVLQIQSTDSTPVGAESQENQSQEEAEDNGGEGTSTAVHLNNNVENQISGEQAEVKNDIENNVNHGGNNSVENNVTNNIDVSLDVHVTNHIMNHVDGDTEDEPDETNGSESNGNGDLNGNGDTNDNGDANGNNGSGNDEKEEDTSEIIWGVDSASLTNENLQACVEEHFGDPDVWGRYLGDNEGVSYGLTSDEVDFIHANDAQILVIWNHFTDGTGYEKGQSEANQAIDKAKDFGIPEGVAIFANVEPIYPIDSEFISGWYDAMQNSEYKPGIYGIFDPDEELYIAFEEAVQNNEEILENTYVWTAAPNIGITSEENAPEFEPEAPEGSLAWGWQYGIEAEACNIDTNLFKSDLLDVLW